MTINPQHPACALVNKYFRKLHLAILRRILRKITITDRDAPQKS